jgi:tetratricopeptide (TPR) repeat protein
VRKTLETQRSFPTLGARWNFFATALFVAHALGCAASRPKTRAPETSETTRVETLGTIVVTPDSTATVPELLRTADAHEKKGELEAAAKLYDRVANVAIDGSEVEALFRAGDAHDKLGKNPEALTRFARFSDRYATHPRFADATLRAIRLAAYLGEWSHAGRLADRLLGRVKEMRPLEAIVVYGAKALELAARGDDANAYLNVERGVSLVERHGLDLAGRLPRDLAQLYFARGEVYRVRGERIRLAPPPPDFLEALERRCQSLLDAQRAYSDTFRAYDAHWSAMAGFRVGELYQKLHEELMRVEPPNTADTQARQQLFEGVMRLRYSVLLEKAGSMMDHTLQMSERAGEQSEWVERARKAREDIRSAEQREREALDRLPYTRAELEAGLKEVEESAKRRQPTR